MFTLSALLARVPKGLPASSRSSSIIAQKGTSTLRAAESLAILAGVKGGATGAEVTLHKQPAFSIAGVDYAVITVTPHTLLARMVPSQSGRTPASTWEVPGGAAIVNLRGCVLLAVYQNGAMTRHCFASVEELASVLLEQGA
eukprot:jgi/Mesvir1/13777/Mv19362-RA.1